MSQPAFAACTEREEIAESIRAVMSRILHLHIAEREALRKHDYRELECIDNELERATAEESSLLATFQAHLREHGCRATTAVVGGA